MKDFLALGEASKPLTSCSKYETLIRVNWSPGSKIHGPSAHCPVEYRLQILSAVRISTKKIKNTPKKIIRKKRNTALNGKTKKGKKRTPIRFKRRNSGNSLFYSVSWWNWRPCWGCHNPASEWPPSSSQGAGDWSSPYSEILSKNKQNYSSSQFRMKDRLFE